MPNVRFGVIGYGLFGAHHAHAIDNTPQADLTAIAVVSEASQNRARADFPSVDVYGDYQQLLSREDIDVCNIVVPNQLHYQVASAALRAGKHVLLEKPMALSAAHCDELVSLAKGNDRVLAVNHELRLSTLWGRVKQLIEQGAIGRPLYAMIELSRFPYRQGSQGWRYDIDRVGDWILEEPIHFFDLARWYLAGEGEPISIYARANSRQSNQPRLCDNFSAVVQFSAGAYAVITQTLAAFGHHQTVKISGTDGTIWAQWGAADARSDAPAFFLQYGLGDKVTEIKYEHMTSELVELAQQIDALVRCVAEGAAPPCSGEDGRWSTRLCLAGAESAASGKLITLEE